MAARTNYWTSKMPLIACTGWVSAYRLLQIPGQVTTRISDNKNSTSENIKIPLKLLKADSERVL
jgi:hypothetical protein